MKYLQNSHGDKFEHKRLVYSIYLKKICGNLHILWISIYTSIETLAELPFQQLFAVRHFEMHTVFFNNGISSFQSQKSL